ncbi:hypothetical protein KCTCHS21_45270 [Cohnella abietis]|uniref:Uncharacterized protein n=1 Tax=Cohnella abietis TaxID=2507935 RepID=A0A3T1DAX4_9BACL|nr:hypothetical protein KCTCHS21_45270 [Cohnella abietis]
MTYDFALGYCRNTVYFGCPNYVTVSGWIYTAVRTMFTGSGDLMNTDERTLSMIEDIRYH